MTKPTREQLARYQPHLMAVLLLLVIGLLFVGRVRVESVQSQVDRNTFAICQALNDARDRAFSSLAGDLRAQGIAIGKVNRTMALLNCAALGYPEKFSVSK